MQWQMDRIGLFDYGFYLFHLLPQKKNFEAKLRKMSGLNWSLLICNVIAWQRTFRGDSFGPGVGWRLFSAQGMLRGYHRRYCIIP